MDSKKAIKVGVTSSLLDLKAELLRKKQELKSSSSRDARGGAVKSSKKSDILRGKLKDNQQNKGVEIRSQKDRLERAEEEKTLEKSKSIMEAKAKLYEKMQKGALLLDDDDDEDGDNFSATKKMFSQSLVNFQQKAIDEIQEKKMKQEDRRTPPSHYEEPSEPYPVDEDEWTEFTDHLGRTRRCLKADLPKFLERDEELARPENPGICLSASAEERLREMKREKWELEAEIIAAKEKVHYQDILFDEVRSHGTGYYAFARDEATRQQQMLELKKLSEQTAANREKIKKERSAKKSQLKAKLKKIRDRKRAKAGLPPLPGDDDDDEDEEEEEKTQEEEVKYEAEPEPKKPRDIRAWDVGKAGVFGPKPVTFDELDEKWLKDRRADRNPEFAPPTSIYSQGGLRKQYNNSNSNDQKPSSSSYASSSSTSSYFSSTAKYQNFVKSKEPSQSTSTNSKPAPVVIEPAPKPFQAPKTFWKQKNQQQPRPPPQKPIPIVDELPAPVSESSEEFDRGQGVEVAPPPTFEYYHGESRQKKEPIPKSNPAEMLDAVSSGLKALREQFESREKQDSNKDKMFSQFT